MLAAMKNPVRGAALMAMTAATFLTVGLLTSAEAAEPDSRAAQSKASCSAKPYVGSVRATRSGGRTQFANKIEQGVAISMKTTVWRGNWRISGRSGKPGKDGYAPMGSYKSGQPSTYWFAFEFQYDRDKWARCSGTLVVR